HSPGPREPDHEMRQLCQELAAVAVQQSFDVAGDTVPARSVCAVGEDADCEHAPRAVEAMDRNGAARVIDVGDVVEEPYAEAHEEAGDDADEARCPWSDEGAGRRDGDQPGEHAVAGH